VRQQLVAQARIRKRSAGCA